SFDVGTQVDQTIGDGQEGGGAYIVGIRLEGDAQQADGGAADHLQQGLQFLDDGFVLTLVGPDGGFHQIHIVVVLLRGVQDGADVFAEATAAPTGPGIQVAHTDAVVQAHAPRDFSDVGTNVLSQPGEFIDKGDLHRQ